MNKEKKIPGHILSLFIILLSISGVCLLMYKAQFRFNLHQPIEYVMMTTHKPTGTITLSSDSPVLTETFTCTVPELKMFTLEGTAKNKTSNARLFITLTNADSGEIYLEGNKIVAANPRQAQDLGIAMVYQELTLVSELTVEENLFLSIEPKNKFGLIDRKEVRKRIFALMDEYDIHINPKAIAGRLSVAEQQMAEILKVLLKNPQIIILDEPTSSLQSEEVVKLFNIVRNLVKKEKTIIFISHRMEEVFEIGDYVTVFKDGTFVGTRKISEIDVDELIKMMVGRPLTQIYPKKSEMVEDTVLLEVKNLKSEKLNDVSFQLHKGEILGIAGLQGHGQTELLDAISGVHKLTQGTIKVNGKEAKIKNAKQALDNGIALVPCDRKNEGLMLILPIQQNLALCSLDKRSKAGFINLKEEQKFAEETRKSLKIKLHNLNDPVSSLSGGNQQKIVLGKELGTDPKIMLFNDPTRGIDVEAKSDFYNIMRKQATEGIGVVLCSSDMMEIIGMSDRVLVMYEGRITGELQKDELSEELIMKKSMGIVEEVAESDK